MAEPRPRSGTKEIVFYPGLEALPVLCEEVYKAYAADGRNFPSEISPSVFDYYIAVLAYCRLLYLHKYNGGDLSPEEQWHISRFSYCKVPELIYQYFSGFGNVKLEGGLSMVFQLLPRNLSVQSHYIENGWFGKISENTHYLYAMYPSLIVYMERIMADLRFSVNEASPTWYLPSFIDVPKNAGKPTQNLLGYKPASHLSSDQILFLNTIGITPQYFSCDYNPRAKFPVQKYKVNEKLIFSTNNILRNHIPMMYSCAETLGSKAQIPFQNAFNVNKESLQSRYLNYQFYHCSSFEVPDADLHKGGAYVYRLKRNVNLGFNPWCIYDFDNFTKVPIEWVSTVNTARIKESDVIQTTRYRSLPFSVQETLSHNLADK